MRGTAAEIDGLASGIDWATQGHKVPAWVPWEGQVMKDPGDRAPAPTTGTRGADRASRELIDICRELLADGRVDQTEAEFLKEWIERNSDFVGTYPFDVVYLQLSAILLDGFVDPDESADLRDTLSQFIDGAAHGVGEQPAPRPTTLPIDDPEPEIYFPESAFVVAGTFSYGCRAMVHAAIDARGGIVAASPSEETRYLVIGDLGSRDWTNSNAGRKIERAVQLRQEGYPLAIVTEAHWAESLQ